MAHAEAVIEHADAALADWLHTLEPVGDVVFETAEAVDGGGKATAKQVVVTLSIRSIRERSDVRDVEVEDVRDDDRRVIERQRSTRWFDVDYQCTPVGDPIAAHRVLGAIIQLLVDHEHVPSKFVPAPVGGPLEVSLVTPARGATGSAGRHAGVVIRVLVPVRPSADTAIAPPAEELALDMMPPPVPRQAVVATPVVGAGVGPAFDPDDRKWTRVRRREMIVRPGEPR